MVHLDDALHDREPQTRAEALGGEERLEDALPDAFPQACPCVLHGDVDRFGPVRFAAHDDGPVAVGDFRHRVDGVDEQVQDHLFQLDAVAADDDRSRGELERERHVANDRIGPEEPGHRPDHFVQVEMRPAELALPEQVPHALDHLFRAPVVRDDVAQRLA